MLPNAFIGKPKRPTAEELSSALGPTKALWDHLLAVLSDGLGICTHEWNSYSPKAGWSLKVKRGERTILYMAPCRGSFRVSFALGDKAVKAALQSKLPPRVLKVIKDAKRYTEGTAVRVEVKTAKDIPIITRLAAAKRDN
jgi:hypothetical protein